MNYTECTEKKTINYISKQGRVYKPYFFLYSGLLAILSGIVSCSSSVVQESLIYKPSGTIHEYYSNKPEKLSITVYPSSRKGMHNGTVLFIHGGGWQTGGSDLPLFQDWENYLNDAGLRAFSIEHRLAPEYRGYDQVEDVAEAIVFIRKNAKRFRIPRDKIALVGFSSGGHLAMIYGFGNSSRSNPVSAVVSFYAPTDLVSLYFQSSGKLKKYMDGYLPGSELIDAIIESDTNRRVKTDFAKDIPPLVPEARKAEMERILDVWTSLSPITYASSGRVPVMILHGENDSLIPYQQAVRFKEKSDLNKGNTIFLLVKNADHNFIVSRSHRINRLRKRVVEFIVRNSQIK